jgi:hypothetical protein
MPDQVRHDERWQKALARYGRAVAGLNAVAHTENDDLYDQALGRHSAALARLLRAPAPDLAAVARKLDLMVRHTVFEMPFGVSAFAALQRDVRQFAGPPFSLSSGPVPGAGADRICETLS